MHDPDEDAVQQAAPDAEVEWRRLDPRLWVGRSGYRTVGTIERGSRYVYVDADGVPHAGRPTLREAQDEATGPIDVVRTPAAPTRDAAGRRLREVVLLVAVALVAAGLLWSSGSLLYLR